MGWCWAIGPAWGCRASTVVAIEKFWGDSGLLMLQSSGACFDQGVLDIASDLRRENRAGVEGSRHRFLPRLEHLIEFATSHRVDQRICVHKRLVHVPSEEEGVWGPDILDDRIDEIQRWQLVLRWCLQKQLEDSTLHHPGGTPTDRMWFSRTLAMAMACSVFSLAITVRLLIWNLSLVMRSSREDL